MKVWLEARRIAANVAKLPGVIAEAITALRGLDEKARAHRKARSITAPGTHCLCREFLYRRRRSIALQ